MRRAALEAALQKLAAPEAQARTVTVTGPTPTTVQVLPGPARIYGVYLSGTGDGAPEVRVDTPAGVLLQAKVPATGHTSATWAPAWVRAAGPVTATKLSGTPGQSLSCTILWSPL